MDRVVCLTPELLYLYNIAAEEETANQNRAAAQAASGRIGYEPVRPELERQGVHLDAAIFQIPANRFVPRHMWD